MSSEIIQIPLKFLLKDSLEYNLCLLLTFVIEVKKYHLPVKENTLFTSLKDFFLVKEPKVGD